MRASPLQGDGDEVMVMVMGRLPVHPKSTFFLLDHDDRSVVLGDIWKVNA